MSVACPSTPSTIVDTDALALRSAMSAGASVLEPGHWPRLAAIAKAYQPTFHVAVADMDAVGPWAHLGRVSHLAGAIGVGPDPAAAKRAADMALALGLVASLFRTSIHIICRVH